MATEASALIVAVPDADPVVSSFRAALDSGASLGVPAHITILYPFMPMSSVDPDVVAQLRSLFSAIDAFEISMTSTGTSDDDVLYVRPEPDAALRQLTARVAERWPQWPPYQGAHPDPTPHLTIADNGDLAAMDEAARAVRRSLPIRVEVSEIQLYSGTEEPGSWHHQLTFPLRTTLR